MVNITSTKHVGYKKSICDGKLKSNFLLQDEWNNLTQEQKDKIFLKRPQFQMSYKPFPSSCHINVYKMDDFTSLDDIIEYTIMNHCVNQQDEKDPIKVTPEANF
jgi:hypothetical protein